MPLRRAEALRSLRSLRANQLRALRELRLRYLLRFPAAPEPPRVAGDIRFTRLRQGPAPCYSADIQAGQSNMVKSWIAIHEQDLLADWELLNTQGTSFKIPPLA